MPVAHDGKALAPIPMPVSALPSGPLSEEGHEYIQRTLTPEETVACGVALGRVAQPGDVFILTGDLGAGKTQFTKGIAQALGIGTPITSPTFNIMLIYEGADGVQLNHIDLYRLDDALQLDDIDYFGCIESNAVSVVEWGDKFGAMMPSDYLEVSMEYDAESAEARRISTIAHGPRSVQMLMDWLEKECGMGNSSRASGGASYIDISAIAAPVEASEAIGSRDGGAAL